MRTPGATKPKPFRTPEELYIGKSIRFHRLRAGMTMKQLGDLIGITFQQIQKYELGVAQVGNRRLLQIARALGVPPRVLLPRDGGEVAELPTDRESVEMLRVFQMLPGKQRASLVEVFRAIIASRSGKKSESQT